VELRRKLVEDFQLLAVVSLPAGVFKPYAGVKTGVLVFRRPMEKRDRRPEAKFAGIFQSPINTPELATPVVSRDYYPHTRKVWFYEVRADGYDPDKIAGGGRPETPERNDIPDLLSQWKEYKASGFKNPTGVEANTLLEAGSPESRAWWAKVEVVAENDYSLAARRYKPQVAERASDDDPLELIQFALAIEENIVRDLKTVLGEVENL
jgi:type I restriction enzyme M protein